MSGIKVTLLDDQGVWAEPIVTDELAALFSYAHQWALVEKPGEAWTLTFSSMLAAMIAGADPLCGWLRTHLALRGIHSDSMTRGHKFSRQPLPPAGLKTTDSFRRAFSKAREIPSHAPADGLAVRHFMAAYAVVPGYHLGDFLRLHIDRRAWCIELAEHLATKLPNENAQWLQYARLANPVPSLGFNTDAPDGRDLLNVSREVEAFARLIASRNTAAPLSVGVFGAWGSGKSFFMHRLQRRVARFAALGRDEGAKSKYHGNIAQIEFNAWHYSEGNLAASFVDHIFRNLRVGRNENAEILRARSEEVVKQLETATRDLSERQAAVGQALALTMQAQNAIVALDAQIGNEIEAKKAQIATAATDLQDTQRKLAQEVTNLQDDIKARVSTAPAATAVSLLFQRLQKPELNEATNNVRTLVAEAKSLRQKRKLMLYGVIILGIGAAATAIMHTNAYAQFIAAAAAIGSFAATASAWLKKLDAFADTGQEFEDEQTRIKKTITDEVTAAHEEVISALRKMTEDRLTSVNQLNQQLQQLQQAPETTRLALDDLEKQRAAAVAKHAEAAAVVEARKADLAKLTTRTLLEEFLDERASNDGYLKELTIFTRIRNDFQKLSDLMTKANEDFVAEKVINNVVAGAPPVSRIVIYIDDLDRCPADRVVAVLKMIHLLLAFPLFVCVAAVDPRWINHCLKEAPGLIVDNSDGLSREFGIPATSSDYLEKIFQIPLWLRPVPSEQRSAITRTLLDPAEPADEPRIDLPVTALRTIVGSSRPEGLEGDGDMSSPAVIDPDLISAAELEYLDRLTTLLDGNLRSLKRFVNTYRLVKTALSDVELAVFLQPLGNGAKYSPYRICMAQLAVLCTQRNRALSIVRQADATKKNAPLLDWLNGIKVGPDKDLAQSIETALNDDIQGTDLDTFKRWLERTRRYSFYL
jgi:KAP family P-loop domain